MNSYRKTTDFFSDFLKKSSSDSDLKKKSRHLDYFEKWLNLVGKSEICPQNLTESDLDEYKKFLQKTKQVKEETLNQYMATIRFFLEFLSSLDISCPSPDKARLKEKKESEVQKIVNYYFETKGITSEKLKVDARKKKIIYSRYTKPAKDLLELAGSVEKAKKAIYRVSEWAKSRNLDYALETVLKKWFELDKLQPKKKEKKPFYKGDRMVKSRGKWHVIDDGGEWLEFVGNEEEIEWKEID